MRGICVDDGGLTVAVGPSGVDWLPDKPGSSAACFPRPKHPAQRAEIAAFDVVGSAPICKSRVVRAVRAKDGVLKRACIEIESQVHLSPAKIPWLGTADKVIDAWLLRWIGHCSGGIHVQVVFLVESGEIPGAGRDQCGLIAADEMVTIPAAELEQSGPTVFRSPCGEIK